MATAAKDRILQAPVDSSNLFCYSDAESNAFVSLKAWAREP